MKKFLFVIPPGNFRDVELLKPKRILEAAGVKTYIASDEVGQVVGADGASVKVDLKIDEVDAEQLDGVAFVGGPGTVLRIDQSNLKELARRFLEKNKLVAAICAASAILANAGVLDGKRATSWAGVKKVLIDRGAVWVERPVVQDGHIITADGPSSASEFGNLIAKAI